MKLWVTTGLTVMAMGLGACGKKAPPPGPTTTPPATEATKAPEADAAPATTPAEADAAPATTPTEADAAPATTPTEADAAPAAEGDAGAAPAEADGGAAATAPAEADGGAAPAPAAEVKRYDGFQLPESVLLVHGAEAKDDYYLVSNIGGSPLGKDDNGYISKVGLDGTKVAEKFIDGAAADVELNAPKGMATDGKSLWVADIDAVRKFDLATGKLVQSIALDGATFANDIAIDAAGHVLVTDSGMKSDGKDGFTDSGSAGIWSIDAATDAANLVAKGPEIGHPNGIAALNDGFITVGFDDSKKVVIYDATAKVTGSFDIGFGMLDGVAVTASNKKGDFGAFVSSWDGGRVLAIDYVDGKATVTTAFEGLKGPADFSWDGKGALVVPALLDGAIEAHTIATAPGATVPKD